MPFPFTVKFTKKLKETLSPEDYPIVFKYLSNYLVEKRVTDIVIKKNVLEFNVKYGRPNWHFILPIDGGEFTFTNKNEYII
ncbi:hypothetical protein ACPPVU_18140 [Mucilaginibacter sp. McL0603]|uniref:hypothetical protein n=1 Tax=Mucilaginibacter sp. McL0603 TaxID=3415670 RepID=UPI003CE99CB3